MIGILKKLGQSGRCAVYSRRRRSLLVLVGSMCCSSALALDFQLHEIPVREDGFTRSQTFLQNDAKSRVLITLPASWNNVGDAASLTMTPPVSTGSLARIEKSSFSPLAFKDRVLEDYRQRTLSAAPQGATGVKILEEHDDAFPFSHWQGYEFVLSYEFFGQNFLRSSLYVNVNAKEQLLVTTIAPKDAYKGVHDTVMDTLRSWQIVPVETDTQH